MIWGLRCPACRPLLQIYAEPYNSQARARPASAQPSDTAPISPTTTNNAVGGASRRRREYWPKHLPPYPDEHHNEDFSSKSGSGGGGNGGANGYYRGSGLRTASSGKRARVPTATAAAAAVNLELRAKTGVQGEWRDDYCAAGMNAAARRALAARVAAAAVETGKVGRSTIARGLGVITLHDYTTVVPHTIQSS